MSGYFSQLVRQTGLSFEPPAEREMAAGDTARPAAEPGASVSPLEIEEFRPSTASPATPFGERTVPEREHEQSEPAGVRDFQTTGESELETVVSESQDELPGPAPQRQPPNRPVAEAKKETTRRPTRQSMASESQQEVDVTSAMETEVVVSSDPTGQEPEQSPAAIHAVPRPVTRVVDRDNSVSARPAAVYSQDSLAIHEAVRKWAAATAGDIVAESEPDVPGEGNMWQRELARTAQRDLPRLVQQQLTAGAIETTPPMHEIHVSLGEIYVHVERPEKKAMRPPAATATSKQTTGRETGSSRLSRHYIRIP